MQTYPMGEELVHFLWQWGMGWGGGAKDPPLTPWKQRQPVLFEQSGSLKKSHPLCFETSSRNASFFESHFPLLLGSLESPTFLHNCL